MGGTSGSTSSARWCPDAEARLKDLLKYNEMSGPAFKIKHDPRITRIGRFLRKSGIDELPQLFNVLRGDMSIVGPRPPLPREVAQYDDYARQRLYITPGITCYWQIQPRRNEMNFRDWVDLDIKYIRERELSGGLEDHLPDLHRGGDPSGPLSARKEQHGIQQG